MGDGQHSRVARHFAGKGTLRQGMNTWQEEGLFTDLTIRCTNGKEHRVHRIVVCPQSRFFHNACKPDSPFKKEAQTGVIELEDDPNVVGAMVSYFYKGTYLASLDSGYNGKVAKSSNVVYDAFFQAKCYVIADKYEIHPMRQYALEGVTKSFLLGKIWTEPEACPELIKYAYENTNDSDRGLRDLLLAQCKNHLPGLMVNKGFVDTMDSIGGFWRELLCCQTNLPQQLPKWATCPGCTKHNLLRLSSSGSGPLEIATTPCSFCKKQYSERQWTERLLPPPYDKEGPDWDDRAATLSRTIAILGKEDGDAATTNATKKRRREGDNDTDELTRMRLLHR